MTMKAKKTAMKRTAPPARKSVKEAIRRGGVAFLIESELEKAELILNAKSISDRLQKMAEEVAKIEADDLMPLLDPMRSAFGPQVADQFNKVVTERTRAAMEAIKSAKDGIGAEIGRLENAVDGRPTNDMAMDDSTMDMPSGDAADPSLDDAEDDTASLPPPPPAPDDKNAPKADAPAPDGDDDGKDPFADLFGDDGDNAAGRPKKESYIPSRHGVVREGSLIPTLRSSSNPDLVILERFRRRLKEGFAPAKAAKYTAHEANVDVADVVEIVREAASRRKVKEGKIPPQFKKHIEKKKAAKKGDGMDDDHDGVPDWKDKKPGRKDTAKKPDADQDGVPNWADKNPFKKGSESKERKVAEAKRKKVKDDPCWKGYEMVGMKKKGGREVPNCVPKNESREAGKSTRPFVGADRPKTVSEAITDQRKAELQQMGFAVNVNGQGFQWVRPEPGKPTFSMQQRTASKNENDAWSDLDREVKKMTSKPGQNAPSQPPKPGQPKPPNKPNPPNSPSSGNTMSGSTMTGNTSGYKVNEETVEEDIIGAIGRLSAFDDLDLKVRVAGNVHGKDVSAKAKEMLDYLKKGVRISGGRGEHLRRFISDVTDVVESIGTKFDFEWAMRQVKRHEGNDRLFPRERFATLMVLLTELHRAAMERKPVEETGRKPAPAKSGGETPHDRRMTKRAGFTNSLQELFDDVVRNVRGLTVKRKGEIARAKFENDTHEVMVEYDGFNIYAFYEEYDRDKRAIRYGEGFVTRDKFIMTLRRWMRAAQAGEALPPSEE